MAAKITVPRGKKKGQTFSKGGKTYKVGTRKVGDGYKRVAIPVSGSGSGSSTSTTKKKGRKKSSKSSSAPSTIKQAMGSRKIGTRFTFKGYEYIVVSGGKSGGKRACKIRRKQSKSKKS